MRVVKLGEVCHVIMGQAPPGDSYNSSGRGVPLLAGAADFGASHPEPSRFTTDPTRLSEVGDILLCVRATIGERNWSDRAYCLGRGVAALRALSPDVDLHYVWHWLPSAKPALMRRARGSTFKQVTRDAVESLSVPLPALAEQRRIAAVLDNADAIRQKRRESMRLLDEFLRSAFLEMFGDPVRNEKEWKVEALGELCRVRRGASPRPKGDPRYFGGPIPWIKISDATLSDGFFIERVAEGLTEEGKYKSVYLEPGSLILSNSGSVGMSYVLASAGCIHDGWLAFDQYESRLNKFYLLSLFRSLTPFFRRVAPTGTQSNLNTGILKKMRIPVPPLGAQQRWERMFRRWYEVSNRAKRARGGTDELFNSLLQWAFRGEL